MNKKLFSLAIFTFMLGLFAEKTNAQASGTNPELYMYRHNGSMGGSPSPVMVGDTVGKLQWRGLTALNAIRQTASIKSYVTNVSPGRISGAMVFSTSGAVGLKERMIILDNGLVGIGTMAPVYHLDVVGNTHTSGDFYGRIHMDANPGPGDAPNTYLQEAYFENKPSADMTPTTGLTDLGSSGGLLTLAPSFNGAGPLNTDHQLFFNAGGIFHRQEAANGGAWTAAWEKILTNGDINGRPNLVARFLPTGSPSNKLGDSQLFDNGTNVVIGGIPAGPNPVPVFVGTDKLTVNGDSRTTGDDAVGGNLNVANNTRTNTLNVSTDATVNGATRLVGKVAIGPGTVSTSGSPDHSLYVGGSIIAEEVVVKLKVNWPDYVFTQNHAVQPLTEVESFIQKEKHLPGVPSATEVAKNGVSLGAMQTVQMEKIEELYLHMIALQKQVEQQQQTIERLESELLNSKK